MQCTKHFIAGLFLLAQAGFMQAENFSDYEVNSLGRIDQSAHKISKISKKGLIAVIGIPVLFGGALVYTERAYINLCIELAKYIPQGEQAPKLSEKYPFVIALFALCMGYSMYEFGALVAENEINFYRLVKGNDFYAAAAANDVAAMYEHGFSQIMQQDEKGRTALMYAAAAGSWSAVRELLWHMPTTINTAGWFEKENKVVAVDMQDVFGRTAAHYAALNHNRAILNLLVNDYSASVAIADNSGVTVAMLLDLQTTYT